MLFLQRRQTGFARSHFFFFRRPNMNPVNQRYHADTSIRKPRNLETDPERPVDCVTNEEHIHGRQPRSVRVRLGLTSAATNPPVDSSKLANMTRVSSSSERAHRGVRFACQSFWRRLARIGKCQDPYTYKERKPNQNILLIVTDRLRLLAVERTRSERSILQYMTGKKTLEHRNWIRRVRFDDKGMIATKAKYSVNRA